MIPDWVVLVSLVTRHRHGWSPYAWWHRAGSGKRLLLTKIFDAPTFDLTLSVLLNESETRNGLVMDFMAAVDEGIDVIAITAGQHLNHTFEHTSLDGDHFLKILASHFLVIDMTKRFAT